MARTRQHKRGMLARLLGAVGGGSRLSLARAAYDGATSGRRGAGWRLVGTDANSEIRIGSGRLRDNARDLVRNNCYASHAKAVICSNAIGSGITPAIVCDNEKTRTRCEDIAKAFFDKAACDADGLLNLYGLQDLALGCIVESGEVLVRLRPRRAEDKLPLPFQLQVLEPDYLDTRVDGQRGAGVAIQGIEYDGIGRRAAYHLLRSHPGNAYGSISAALESSRVPADQIAHVFLRERPGQARGVTWYAPVVLRVRDFGDYFDASLMRQKIAACFAAFVTSEADEGVDATKADGDTYPVEAFEPGMIERLRAGENVSFASPPAVQDLRDWSNVTLHEIAAGLNISYEALTGDLSGVNFSSGRMGWLEFQRQIDRWRMKMLAPMLLEPIGRWFVQGCELVGAAKPGEISVEWTPPRREMISPRDEVPYLTKMIRAGLLTRSEALRKLGYDPDDVDAEFARDNERADAAGLIFDTDPRQRTESGAGVAAAGDAVLADASADTDPDTDPDTEDDDNDKPAYRQ